MNFIYLIFTEAAVFIKAKNVAFFQKDYLKNKLGHSKLFSSLEVHIHKENGFFNCKLKITSTKCEKCAFKSEYDSNLIFQYLVRKRWNFVKKNLLRFYKELLILNYLALNPKLL